MTDKPKFDVTDRAHARMDDDGGVMLPVTPKPLPGEQLPLPLAAEGAEYRTFDSAEEGDAFFSKAVELAYRPETLPLAPPRAPVLLKDEHMRIAFIPEDKDKPLRALALNFEGEDAAIANAKLYPGTMQIDIANGFGGVRTLRMSPAEFMLFAMYADRFFAELPR